MSVATERAPLAELAVDQIIQAAASEQRIALLSQLDEEAYVEIPELRNALIETCGYPRNGYFNGTVDNELRRIGSFATDYLPELGIVRRTRGGTYAAALGGLWLERVIEPSDGLSLVHVFAQPDKREDVTEGQQFSGHWRIYKLLDTMLSDNVTVNTMREEYEAAESPISRKGLRKVINRLISVDLVEHTGEVVSREKVWTLTESGQEVAAGIVESVAELRAEPQSTERAGLDTLRRYTDAQGDRSGFLLEAINRSKQAGGHQRQRLVEVNDKLTQIARERGGAITLNTTEIRCLLGNEITHSILTRIIHGLPNPSIRSFTPHGAGHDGNTWEIVAPTNISE